MLLHPVVPGGWITIVATAARTLAAAQQDEFTIVRAHNPALWPALARRGVDLTLSGHTHSGQLALPHIGWSLASPFLDHAMGVHRQDASVLYINPGTNYWGVPFRLGAWPEVTVVTLRAAPHVPSLSVTLPASPPRQHPP